MAEGLAIRDNRIKLIKNETNLGLNETLNRCFAISKGEYIARMDGDDNCLPSRLEKQLAILESNNGFDIVSSAMVLFDENGEWGSKKVMEDAQPKDLARGTLICHAPVMMRRECMEKVGGYSKEKYTIRVKDVDLCIRLYAVGYRCYNIQEPLYHMRNGKDAVKRRKYRYRVNLTRVRLMGCSTLGLGFSDRLWAFEPMLVGLIPGFVRQGIRRIQNRKG